MSLQFNGVGNVTIPLWTETGDFNISGTATHKTALEILIGNINSVDSFIAVGADATGNTARAKIAASTSFLDLSPFTDNQELVYELKRVGTLVTLTINGSSISGTLTGDVRFNVLGEYINGLNYNGLMSGTLTMISASNSTRTYDMNGSGTTLVDTTSGENGTLTGGVSFTVVSNTAPVITVSGSETTTITEGDAAPTFTATASDAEDGDITGSIIIAGDTVDANTAGIYIITYNVDDSQSESAAEVTRTVVVQQASVVNISPNNSDILYSPYNWLVTSTEAKSINSGAYFRVEFTSATCVLNFDLTGCVAPYSRLLIRVDGRTFQKDTVAATVGVTIPSDQTNTKHLLEVYFDASTGTVNRWLQQNAIKLTGITLASGGTVSAPKERKNKLLVFGDSITEGANTLTTTGAQDIDDNSSVACYSTKIGELTNSEVGVVGFGGTAFTHGGVGNVPAFPDTYDSLWSGQARDFTEDADLCIIAHGQNDSTSNIVPIGVPILDSLMSSMPTTKFILLRTFGNSLQAANLQTIANTCNQPERALYVDTEGFWDNTDTEDAVHPIGYSSISDIAISVADVIDTALNNFIGSATSTLNLTSTEVPDGTYGADVYDIDTKLPIETLNVTFSGETAIVDVSAAVGTKVLLYIDSETPLLTGLAYRGVTE